MILNLINALSSKPPEYQHRFEDPESVKDTVPLAPHHSHLLENMYDETERSKGIIVGHRVESEDSFALVMQF